MNDDANADLKNVNSNADSHAANDDANDSSNVVQGQYSAVQGRANVVQASLVHAQGECGAGSVWCRMSVV